MTLLVLSVLVVVLFESITFVVVSVVVFVDELFDATVLPVVVSVEDEVDVEVCVLGLLDPSVLPFADRELPPDTSTLAA